MDRILTGLLAQFFVERGGALHLQDVIGKQNIGDRTPEFSLETLAGGRAGLQTTLAGKRAAVIIIWSSTCSHCIRYDKYLNAFEELHPDIGLLIVSSRRGESLESVKKAVAQRQLRFPIVHDPNSEVAQQWFAQQTPRAFLISGDGTLLYRGAIDNYKYAEDPEYIAYLEPAIRQFMNNEAIGKAETASYGCAIQSVYYTLPRAL